MRKTVVCLLLVMSSLNIRAALPANIAYQCDPVLEPCFLKQFAEWNVALGGYFTLLPAAPGDTPTITVERVSILPLTSVGSELPASSVGGTITIQILDHMPLFPLTELDTVMLHEIGHALGLGHSPNAWDVMYFAPSAIMLSAGDVTAVRTLYGLSPDLELSLFITVALSPRQPGMPRTKRLKIRVFSSNYPVLWDFGDGSKVTAPTSTPFTHAFPARGTYAVSATYLGVVNTISVRVR